jgi:hypothetical protein
MDHIRTFLKTDGEHIDVGDFLLFFGLPLVSSLALVFTGRRLTEQTTSLLLTAFSIFAGLLLNLLVLVHSLIRRYRSEDKFKDARRLLRELYANMSYGVLVCIVGILPLVVADGGSGYTWKAIIAGTVFFISLHFLLTLLMILKRVHVLLSTEFRYPAAS